MTTKPAPVLRIDDGPSGDGDRFRLYRRRGRQLVCIAATSREGLGLTLTTLHGEGEWDDRDRVGILDGVTRDWLVNPYVSGEAP